MFPPAIWWMGNCSSSAETLNEPFNAAAQTEHVVVFTSILCVLSHRQEITSLPVGAFFELYEENMADIAPHLNVLNLWMLNFVWNKPIQKMNIIPRYLHADEVHFEPQNVTAVANLHNLIGHIIDPSYCIMEEDIHD